MAACLNGNCKDSSITRNPSTSWVEALGKVEIGNGDADAPEGESAGPVIRHFGDLRAGDASFMPGQFTLEIN
jgi:hypothetical protein